MEEARPARRWALAALGRRAHSRFELAQGMRRKGFSSSEVEEVLSELSRAGWVDDRRFAGEFAASRARRGFGRARVKAELAARGVEGESSDQALRAAYPPGEEAERARAAAEKKEKTLSRTGIDREAALARFLRGRGFTADAIARALAERKKERGA